MDPNKEKEMKKRLIDKAGLSYEQTEAVLKWLSKNKEKQVTFELMLEKDIEMMLDSGVVSEDKGIDIQSWSWQQIKEWMSENE